MKKHMRLALLSLVVLPMVACSRSGTAPADKAASAAQSVASVEATIRKNLQERLPQMPAIEEVRTTPVAGLYEVRLGPSSIFYTDAQGDYLIQGAMLDTKARRNLTEERVQSLNAVDFKSLPLKDAIEVKHGNGRRKLAVFSDPNCSHCGHLEAELGKVKDVTVYTFMYPILGSDSVAKSQNIWCAADRAKAWQDWMLHRKAPATAQCDAEVIQRNMALGQQLRINGTPAIVFEDGRRIPGAMDAESIEELLAKKP